MHRAVALVSLLVFSTCSLAKSEELAPCKANLASGIEIVKLIPPNYPTTQGAVVGGWVKLAVKVDSNGKVVDIQIVDSKPGRVFVRSAKKAVKKWKFSKSSSNAIRCGITAINFKLED